MCAYCMMGDHSFRYNPPWQETHPLVPQPMPGVTLNPWGLQQLKEYRDLLKEIRDMEAKIGCPCEPNKADYIAMFEKRIAALEAKAASE